MLESTYQGKLIKKLEKLFPGATILKNDANYRQGIPDLSILWKTKWAMLEVKASCDAPESPNQPYWVEKLNEDSFAAFIYPENEQEVLDALQAAFGVAG